MSAKPGNSIIGGGPKKILYTLNTVRRIGLLNSAKALTSHNTCKSCGLGMGGQHGGMTNELDEYPSVCNKSVQAQSTDIQAPIPLEVFDHSLDEFQKLSAREMETLGRLDTPLIKRRGDQHFTPTDWDSALAFGAERLRRSQPERTFFYSSGRSSNEAGFVLQLLARVFGTNNVSNCSFYCHQATSIGLGNSIGTGTATIELEDLDGCDLIFVIGANPASNHPRFIHKLQACRDRGGEVIVINPAREPGLVRFALPKSAKSMMRGGSWIASAYLQPNIGSDIALFTAIGKALVELDAIDDEFISAHTRDFSDYRRQLANSDWQELCSTTGIGRDAVVDVAKRYATANNAVFAWGMGITHHRHGVDNVEAIANLALLRGMIGKRYAGLLPLRGHSNVQGIGTIGVKPVLAHDVFENLQRYLGLTLPDTPGLDTLASLTAAHDGAMDAAVLLGGNLYQATPDSEWAAQALNRIGSKLYLTTTLNQGHVHGIDDGDVVILPVTARDEEWQPTTQESMFNYVRLSDGGIRRLANARPEVNILCDLAMRLLPDSPVDFAAYQSHHSVREAIARTVPGMEALADLDVARREFHVASRLLHQPAFNTADGRGRFLCHDWRASQRLKDGDYPFLLMSVRSEGQFNSIIYEENDSYRGTQDRWVVMMSHNDMQRLGLQDDTRVTVKSAYGKMAGLRVHGFDLADGNVMAYYPEANVLTGRDTDPRSKTPAFKSVAVAISGSE